MGKFKSVSNTNRKPSISKFNPVWKKQYFWIQAVKNECSKAFCILCKKMFTIEYTGITGVKRHSKSETHIRNENNHSSGNQQLHLSLDETQAVTLSTPGMGCCLSLCFYFSNGTISKPEYKRFMSVSICSVYFVFI